MSEKITALYTNLSDANNAMCNLKSNGVKSACINTSDLGLHRDYNQIQKHKKFPGAVPSTIVKLEIDVDTSTRNSAMSVVEGSFGFID